MKEPTCPVCGDYWHLGPCSEVMLRRRRQKAWHLTALLALCVAIYLLCGWNNGRREAWYSEADCGPDCVEVHQ